MTAQHLFDYRAVNVPACEWSGLPAKTINSPSREPHPGFWVYVIPGGKAYYEGMTELVLSASGPVANCSGSKVRIGVDQAFPLLQKLPKLQEQFVNGTVAVLSVAWHYYHFTVETLGQIALLKFAGVWDRIDKIAVFGSIEQPHLSFVKAYFRSLGVLDKVISIPKSTTLRASNLIVPSKTSLAGFIPQKWVFDYIKQDVVPRLRQKSALGPKLHIDRTGAKYRLLANNNELIRCLGRFGYINFRPDLLTLPCECGAFEQAERLISVRGSGLTNLVWCAPGTHVLEILCKSAISDLFRAISHNIGVRYFRCIGEAADARPNLDHRDIIAPMDRIVDWAGMRE